jgi:hypothetical protein
MNWKRKSVFFLLHIAAIKSSILLKEFKTNQNQKGTGYSFEDIVLAVLIKSEPQEREDEKDSLSDKSTTSISTASTPLPCKGQLLKDPADHLQGGFRKHKTVHIPQSEKRKCVALRRCI